MATLATTKGYNDPGYMHDIKQMEKRKKRLQETELDLEFTSRELALKKKLIKTLKEQLQKQI